MAMSGTQRTRVLLAAIAAVVAIVGAVWASQSIGGDHNECTGQTVCGQNNHHNNVNSTDGAEEETAR
jgi:hypothetical protein